MDKRISTLTALRRQAKPNCVPGFQFDGRLWLDCPPGVREGNASSPSNFQQHGLARRFHHGLLDGNSGVLVLRRAKKQPASPLGRWRTRGLAPRTPALLQLHQCFTNRRRRLVRNMGSALPGLSPFVVKGEKSSRQCNRGRSRHRNQGKG